MKWTVAFAACLAFVSAQNATLPYSSQNTTAPAGTTAAAAKTTASPPTAASKEATVNSYNVTVPGTNHTCIMVEAAMQVKVVYATKDGQVKEAVLPLDNETVVDPVRSSCTSSSGEQTLVLLFGHNNILSLVFAKNGTVYLHKLFVEVFFSTDLFPGAVKPEDRSYYCKVDQPVYVGANVTVDVLSAQLQAFRNATAEAVGQFGAAVECSAGDISNIVPIAVGSALAALVIIVLIAYLIGRSKSRQKGYQSV
ncbi:hypothetical protein MRX96_022341 [Rhipicephalus microplus]